MDDGSGPDQYEEQLKEVFDSFDGGGGALNPEELSALCQSLQLDHSALLHALLQNQDHDRLPSRVDFDQFKDALIQVLSSAAEPPAAQHKPSPEPVSDSPEIQPKFVKGSKRYGRRSTPEFLEAPALGSSEVTQPAAEEDFEDNDDSAVPRKRERWNAHESCSEEYEAEGQLHLWNPDEPSTPRRSTAPLPSRLEEKLREACEELRITWDGCAAHSELLALCEHSGLEINKDVLFSLTGDAVMNVQEFVSRVLNQNKPPTPSASTPYRQLKRHHSTQPFDEGGRRIATTSALTSTIGMRLFSTLDDGSGFTPAESILDAWIEEGIENSTEILQALNFDLEGKVSLCELTSALENELLVTKNGIQQAAVASFRAEILHLLERVDREIREKEKIRSDLEKTEKLKTRLAAEVDEHHSAIELMNNLNLRKLEQNQREKLAAVRSNLMKEMDLIQQQAGLQRDQMEAEIDKIREDESFLRDHLSISVKENRRLERELLDSSEKLLEAQNQISKLQVNMDSVMKDKFGDLDPGTADFLLQEERIKQLHSSYEAQCRELQDRIDELQSELRDLHSLGRTHQPGHKPLSEELESKSPGMESDPGIGSEEVQPFSMTLEVEMMLERLKEQHLQEMEDLRKELESKVDEFDLSVEKQRVSHDLQLVAVALQHRQEVQALREEMTAMQSHQQELQNQLQQVELERTEQVQNLQLQLQDADTHAADLQEQLRTLEIQQAETDEDLPSELEELRERHAAEVKKMKGEHSELLEEIKDLTEEKEELQRRLLDDWEREKKPLEESHEDELRAKLEEAAGKFEAERDETVRRLTAEWQKEKTRLDEQNNESLQLLLEEEMLRLVREQEEKEDRLREQWEGERGRLQERQEEALLHRVLEERLTLQEQFDERENRLKEEWEREKLQLEEDYEGMVQDRLQEQREKMEEQREKMEEQKEKMEEQRKKMEEEREKMEEQKEKMGAEREEMEAEREEMEEQREKMEAEMEEQREKMEEQRELMMKTVEEVKAEERARLEENHREAMKELSMKHGEERDALSASLDRLRDDIAQERSEASRLAEENVSLRQKITALKEEDLKEIQEELIQTLDHLKEEKSSAQKAAVRFQKQISDLRLHSRQLLDENGTLAESNALNAADTEHLRLRLSELTERREAFPAEERNKLAACVSALEAELTRALEDTAQLEERNIQLSQQLCDLRQNVSATEAVVVETMESQLSHIVEERKSADKEAAGLRSQLAKAQERNHVLEKALHSSGLQHQSKKLYRDEMSRLMEKEQQQLLQQENERLQAELRSITGSLVQSREKVRQLDATILSLKQQQQHQSQASLLKALEQENAALKQELEAQRELTKGCEAGQRHSELDSLQQENEALKTQMARMSSQLLETIQAQLVGLLPPSPHRLPRGGPHRGEEPDNLQGAVPAPVAEQRAAHADSYRRIGGL
ncbi:ninein-like [Embiotoca jacksoni]|uniref:ninein-like n=1 Tax=Embiotoca jacksoni TaxID=100190 RepID=UPI0037043E8B